MKAFTTPAATRAVHLLMRRAPGNVPLMFSSPTPLRRFSVNTRFMASEKAKAPKSRRNSSSVSDKTKSKKAEDEPKTDSKEITEAEAPAKSNEDVKSDSTSTGPELTIESKEGLVDGKMLNPVEETPDAASLDSSQRPSSDADGNIVSDDYLTTIFDNMEPYIDTYEVYKQLVTAGFTPSQSDEIISLLVVQLNTKLTKLSTKYTQLYELENERYLFESAQQELGVDITRNRELHINDAINQINELQRDYGIISDELNNQFIQMKNDIQVAINDQKSENTLMSKRIMLRMQETNHRITTELNMAMRSEIESLRWHLSRWGLISILLSICAGCAAFWIYKSKHQKRMNERNEFVPLVIYEPSEYDEDDYHADLDPHAI